MTGGDARKARAVRSRRPGPGQRHDRGSQSCTYAIAGPSPPPCGSRLMGIARSLPAGKVGVKVRRVASASPGPPAPGPRYRVAEDEILDAASAVFAAQGFASAKMATIAARAGPTKPTLHARFGSKEALYA